MNTIAVIPAHNESQFISKVVEETYEYVGRVIVVDDGSSDDTQERAAESGAIVFRNERNMGKWVALNRGFSIALEMGADVVVTLDGDGQHEPAEIPSFLHELSDETDVVLGVRQRKGAMPIIRKISNYITTYLVNGLFSLKVSDSQCGYRAYTRRALTALTVSSTGFEGETESLVRLGREGLRMKEVQIKTLYGSEKSKMRALRDTWRFLKTIIKLKLEEL